MLKITNYKKIEGSKLGDWVCVGVWDHEGVYRFSCYKFEGKIYTEINLYKNSVIVGDGNEVFTLQHPNTKLTTMVSKKYISSLDKMTTRFKEILIGYA